MKQNRIKWRRVLLKIGGESLTDKKECPLSFSQINSIAKELGEVKDLGVKMGVIVGGGNILRGEIASQRGMDRATADYICLLYTSPSPRDS